MNAYTHRERVLAALNHQEPDRIPLDLMGNASMILDDSYFRLRDYLGFEPIPPIRSGSTANYYDERILEYFDIDFRRIFLKKKAPQRKRTTAEGVNLDAWGIGYRAEGLWVNAVVHPLHGVTTVKEVEAYDWPKAEEMYDASGLAAQARKMYEETDFALVARNPLTYGLLDRSCQLMEMPEFLMTLALYPLVAQAIIEHLLQIYKDVYTLFLDAVGPYVQMVEYGDDLGGQDNLLISPGMYRKYIKPAEMALFDLIHEKAPHAAVFRHTDGAVFDVIPDFVEVGINVLNPTQTTSRGMEGPLIKQAYGDNITFHGSVDGIEGEVSKDQIIAEVKKRIDELAPGGGYILSSCNHIIDVPPENIIALFETAREYGRYQ